MNKSQIKKALTETESRLEKAHADLAKAQEKVRTLTQKIPELQQAVNSLRVLVGHKPKATDITPAMQEILKKNMPMIPGKLTADEAKKLAMPRDLSGVGSIPPITGGPSEPEPTEDEILPEPEGEEIVE